jgi:hypothetical protein
MSDERVLRQQAEAARTLILNMKDVIAGDEDIALTTLEGETDLFEAIDEAVARVRELETLQDAIKERTASLKQRMDRYATQEQRIRTCLAVAFEMVDIKRLERPEATLTLAKTKAKVVVTNEADIPAKFWKQPDPTIDLKALLAALKDKETVAGAELSNGGTSISIRKG